MLRCALLPRYSSSDTVNETSYVETSYVETIDAHDWTQVA